MYLYSRDSFHLKWGSVDDGGGMGGCSKQGVHALCVSVLLLPAVNFPWPSLVPVSATYGLTCSLDTWLESACLRKSSLDQCEPWTSGKI